MIGSAYNNIHGTVKIGENVIIGRNVLIERDCVIGDGVFIGNNNVIRNNVVIGNRTKIGHMLVFEGNAAIGEDCVIQSQCHMTNGIVIEDKVFIGPMVCTMNDRKIVHLRREKNPFIVSAPTIKYGARIGSASVLLPDSVVGVECLIGAGSLVSGICEDYYIYYGRPVEKIREVPMEERL